MSEERPYSIEGADAFLRLAKTYVDSGNMQKGEDAIAVFYNSKLANEIALKDLLNDAGFDEKELRRIGHDLEVLLRLLNECEEDIPVGCKSYSKPPIDIRCAVIHHRGTQSTVGNIIERAATEESRYPSEFRYARRVDSFAPEVWIKDAEHVIRFYREKTGHIRRKKRFGRTRKRSGARFRTMHGNGFQRSPLRHGFMSARG